MHLLLPQYITPVWKVQKIFQKRVDTFKTVLYNGIVWKTKLNQTKGEQKNEVHGAGEQKVYGSG